MNGTYWTPASFSTDAQAAAPEAQHQEPTLDALQGVWEHSNLQAPIVVHNSHVKLGNRQHCFTFSPQGMVTALTGWELIAFDGKSVRWQSADGHSCTWSRKQRGPKRQRCTSQRKMEAERDLDEVKSWITSQRRKAAKPQPAPSTLAPKSNKSCAAPETNPKSTQPVVPAVVGKPKRKVTEAELRRLTKQLQKRFRVVDKDTGNSGSSFCASNTGGSGRKGGWLHALPHVPEEWAGWSRLHPHSRTYEVWLMVWPKRAVTHTLAAGVGRAGCGWIPCETSRSRGAFCSH